jgi:polyferredoxin
MRKWTEKVSIALLVVFGLLWAGAKIHFFARYWDYYEAGDVRGYILEHWPFWAAMGVVALLGLLLGAIERRRSA